MKYYKEIKLNGYDIILKSSEIEDALMIIDNFKITHNETDFLSCGSDEFNPTIDKEEKWIKNMIDNPKALSIFVYINNKIVGDASIEPKSKLLRMSHRCEFGIAIQKEYWNIGIGNILTDECIKEAKKMGYEQIELLVLQDNTKAIHLYEKYGFKRSGIIENAMKIKDEYHNEVLMIKDIKGGI